MEEVLVIQEKYRVISIVCNENNMQLVRLIVLFASKPTKTAINVLSILEDYCLYMLNGVIYM